MLEGTTIGSYRVIRQIGAGGMGEVWLAEHLSLGRKAAIKVLRPELSRRDDIVMRFFNEARAATAISDPGIVQIFDVGQHTDGSAYIVMELLEGEPLDERVRRAGTLPLGETLQLIRQVATSLGSAHARNIVHRDLKPENIFIVHDAEVSQGQRAKLLDFGIAKLIGDTSGIKTQTAAVLGTPAYMSPEQCRGAGLVDARSDVYSLGCVLFTLVTGRPPFEGEGIGDLIVMHLRELAPRASAFVPGLPVALDDVIARCLDKDPDARFRTGTELAWALSAIGGATVELPATSSRLTPMPTTLSSLAFEVPPKRTPRTWIISAVLATVVIVSAMALRARRSEVVTADAAPTDSATTAFPASVHFEEPVLELLEHELTHAAGAGQPFDEPPPVVPPIPQAVKQTKRPNPVIPLPVPDERQ